MNDWFISSTLKGRIFKGISNYFLSDYFSSKNQIVLQNILYTHQRYHTIITDYWIGKKYINKKKQKNLHDLHWLKIKFIAVKKTNYCSTFANPSL